MEPITATLTGGAAKTAISFSLDMVKKYFEEAQKNKNNLLLSIRNYSDGALEAIKGLENEYNAILTQAKYCRMGDPQKVDALRIRLRDYLTGDQLKNELETGILALENCRKKLTTRAGKSLWPPTKKNRKEAVAELDRLLTDLNQYLNELYEKGFKYRRQRTGVGIKWLLKIQDRLEARIDSAGPTLEDIVEQAEQDVTKGNLTEHTRHIRSTIHQIQDAFE